MAEGVKTWFLLTDRESKTHTERNRKRNERDKGREIEIDK